MMNFMKRALRGIRYYKKNTLLLFLIFTILSTLILSGLCIRFASEETARKTGIEIGGSVIVQGKDLPDSLKEGNLLSLESARRAAELEPVAETVFVSHTLACAKGFQANESVFDDTPQSDYNLSLLGADGVHPDLRDKYRLLEGRKPEPGDQNVAVIHQWLSDSWNLHPGDHISVTSEKDGGTEVDLEIIGVHIKDVEYHYGEIYKFSENTIYTDLETVQRLNGNTNLRWAEYVMKDPAEIPAFLEDVEALNFPERESLGFVPMDGDYRKIAMSMESLVNMATLIFGAAILLGAVILTALVMISLGSREYEIGVLLSMGENRAKVILQLVVEVLVPVLLSVTAGVALSGWTASVAGDLLGAAERGIEVGLQPVPVLLMYLCGVGLALAASCVTVYKVLRYQPKKMLMAME